jgi:hypothetical protein
MAGIYGTRDILPGYNRTHGEDLLMGLRGIVREATPLAVRRQVRAVRLRALRRRNATRSTEQVFSEIYENGAWGQTQSFDSGSGTRGPAREPYVSLVRDLIAETGARRAVDIGCGDFRIASGFVDALETYVGIDVVSGLIERNTIEFGRPSVSFMALDAAASDVPDADICFIRQVFQHLSNVEIAAILERCSKFPMVVVTEHWPSPQRQRRPNRDKPHGGDTRVDFGSWVDISAEPFACTRTSERLVVSYDDGVWAFPGETIRTVVWIPERALSDPGSPLLPTWTGPAEG